MRRLFPILILCVAMLTACNTKSADASEHEATEADEGFAPEGGMPLSQLTDLPDVKWSFDTIQGICAPDTFLLWMNYEGKDYMTNVLGVADRFPLLTVSGNNRIAKSLESPKFIKTDFDGYAALSYNIDFTRDEFKQLRDTAYVRGLNELKAVVLDFYNSLGMTKYMARALANNWTVINNQSEAVGEEAPNPFNGDTYIEFEPGSISVEVPYPSEGIVEVAAYCLDPFTLGRPGWAYWTVKMCREDGQFKVKEMPARHRRFTGA